MARLDHIFDLRVFEALARLGSLTSAARDLDITLAVASKRLQRLEAVVGVRLADRTTRSVRLTHDGEALLSRCRSVLSAVDSAEDTMSSSATGVIRIGAAVAFAQRQIAPRLPTFLNANPGVRVEISASNPIVDLVGGGIDITFRQIAPLPPDPMIRARFPDGHALVASPEYLARAGKPAVPEELSKHRLLTVGLPAPRHWRLTNGEDIQDVAIVGALTGNDGESVHAAAVAGGGIALKSVWEVVDDLQTGRLVHVLPKWHCGMRQVHIILPMREHEPRRVLRLVQFFRTELEAEASRLLPVVATG